VTTVAALVVATGLALATINRILVQLKETGVVPELTQRQRDRVFSYKAYVDVRNTEL